MPQFFVVTTNRYLQFVVDVAVSAFLTYVLSALVWGLIAEGGQGAAFLVMWTGLLFLLPVVIAVPFLVFPTWAVATGRFGLMFGPIILAATTYAVSSLVVRQKEDVISTLTSVRAEPVRADHTLLALGGEGQCDQACVKVLATSNHTIALRVEDRRVLNWTLYTSATGSVCLAKENAALALDFLQNGFPGKCATQTTIVNFDDGLYLRKRMPDPRWWPAPDLPEGFTGTVYEYFERIGGQDHVLARYMKGGMAPITHSLLLVEKRPRPIDAGHPIDRYIFLANAVGENVDALRRPPDPFPFDQVLAEIEAYFGRKEIVNGGSSTIQNLAMLAWQSVARSEGRQGQDYLKRRMLKQFASRDPFHIELALRLTYDLPPGSRRFSDADDLMLDLMFVPISGDASSQLQKLLEEQFAADRPPPSAELRDRAKAHLNDPDLKPWQRQFLNRLSNS
jgi:hypothetical protein